MQVDSHNFFKLKARRRGRRTPPTTTAKGRSRGAPQRRAILSMYHPPGGDAWDPEGTISEPRQVMQRIYSGQRSPASLLVLYY